jgi:16S rRNA (guanine1207-N2)-methyltransferase
MARPESDPAIRLLLERSEETGDRALLILAGSGELAAGFAPRFAEVVSHNIHHPLHAASLAAVRERGLAHVRCVLGDLPCCEREGEGEPCLSDIRFPAGHFDLIAFRLGRGTAQLNAVIAEAFRLLRPGGVLLAAGANQEGIKSFAKRAEEHFGNLDLLGLKSSCRLLRLRKQSETPARPVEDPGYFRPVALDLEIPGGAKVGYLTKPGIFAYRATDPGTALLARHLPDCSGRKVLDLCCGSGALSLAAFRLGAASVTAVDVNAIAIACASRNLAPFGGTARALCADFADFRETGFDIVLSNPPFHRDAETDYSLPGKILDAILAHLRPGGEAWVVANRFLDYGAQAGKRFPVAEAPVRDQGYLIHHMVKGN